MSKAGEPDWELAKTLYGAGTLSIRQICQRTNASIGGLYKRIENEGWTRDLSERIRAAANAKVAQRQAAAQRMAKIKEDRVPTKPLKPATEAEIVDVVSDVIAEVRERHRAHATRALELASKMFLELEAQTDSPELFGKVGEMLRDPDLPTAARLYEAVLSLPERTKTLKLLGESLKNFVDMEARAFGLDRAPEPPPAPAQVDPMEAARRIAFALAQAANQLPEQVVH